VVDLDVGPIRSSTTSTIGELLARRLFPSQIVMPAVWQGYCDRTVETLCLPNGKRHDLTYAY